VAGRGVAGRVARRWRAGARPAGWRDGSGPGRGGPGGETVADRGEAGRSEAGPVTGWRTGARRAGWRDGG
jgi:hypothetical protein